jgi:hypothetical protein
MLTRSGVREVETVVSVEEVTGRMDDSDVETFDEPILFFPEADNPEQSRGKRYPIFQVPISKEGFDTYCFKFIGCGATFCTVQDCTISHKGGGTVEAVNAGDVFVSKKPAGLAFVIPMVDGHPIHNCVVDE